MKDVKINITSAGFPSQFVSDAEKATDEFGLQIGQAIQYEWFRKRWKQLQVLRPMERLSQIKTIRKR